MRIPIPYGEEMGKILPIVAFDAAIAELLLPCYWYLDAAL